MSAFDHALGFFEHHFGYLDVTRSLFVEGRSHDFGLYVACHFGYLLRTLVDQQYDHIDFRMIVGDGVGDRLHEHRFTGLGLGDDQRTLPLADRREEIHDAAREVVVAVARETEFFAREKRGHEFELYAIADVLRFQSVDVRHAHQREILLALFGRADRAGHRVARLQSEELDLRRRNVDVVRGVQVVVVCRAQEPVAVRHYLQNAFTGDFSRKIVFGNDLFRWMRCGECLRFLVHSWTRFAVQGDFFYLWFGSICACE